MWVPSFRLKKLSKIILKIDTGLAFLFCLRAKVIFDQLFSSSLKYSSVPNRHVGQNKRAGGKILKKKIKRADPNKAV